MEKTKEDGWKDQEVEVRRLDFSWKIDINGETALTCWLPHGRARKQDIAVIDKLLDQLNTKS